MNNFLRSFIVLFLIVFCSTCRRSQGGDHSITTFSKTQLRETLQKTSNDIEKKAALDSVYRASSDLESDSLRSELLLEIAYQYSKISDTSSFLVVNREAREHLEREGDTLGLASGFWDLGNHYFRFAENDSAYYFYNRARVLYELKGDDFSRARMLLNMAMVQKNIRDYVGSEKTTIEAIRLLEPLDKYQQLYTAFNNLGLLFTRMEEGEKALEYFEEAEDYLSLAGMEENWPFLWNNIGRVYSQSGKYGKANQFYQKALSFIENQLEEDPKMYAILLDNFAYNRFLSGKDETVLEDFYKALDIREENKILDGVVVSQLHLAEYFTREGNYYVAREYALEAADMALANSNYRDYLASLKLLAGLDPKEGLAYSNEYIRISDSLYKEERGMRNKFSRIRFETDQYIAKNQTLNERVWFLSAAIFLLIVMSLLLYIIKTERTRNKLTHQQQKANRDIYRLVLAQQIKFEEGREKEKRRISRELHDGVLGKLFGIQLSLDSLNEEDSAESKERRYHYIDDIREIAEEIRVISHQLQHSGMQDVNFSVLVEALVREQDGQIKFDLEMDNELDWRLISDTVKMNIYRIIQEACMNIQKHSNASTAQVGISKVADYLIVNIMDDGKGFDIKNVERGIGLRNISDRVSELKGSELNLASDASGTTIRIIVKDYYNKQDYRNEDKGS